MSFFTTNWRTQVINILPPLLRSGTMQDFISALVHPLQTDIDGKNQWSIDTQTISYINGQKILLDAGLNYVFGITSAPFMYVQTQTTGGTRLYSYNESEPYAPFYSFNESEGKSPAYSYNESEIISQVNFIVWCPSAIYNSTVDAQIKQYITTWRLAGKTFIIKTY